MPSVGNENNPQALFCQPVGQAPRMVLPATAGYPVLRLLNTRNTLDAKLE